MQFTTVRIKEKDYYIYLKSEKRFTGIRSTKKMFPSYLETEKSRSLVFGDQKMQFTTVRSKEKDNDIYLKSEKLVHSNQEHEKKVSQLFGSAKHWFLQ